MMDNLRAASNHVVLKVILGVIILSFVLTGVGNYIIGGNSDYAAKVNGQEISRAQLEQAFNNERSRQQQMLGDQFSQLASNDGYMQQMRQQALSHLVDQALLDQYIHDLHISISDEQVKQAIFAQQAFQTNGKFDNAKYNSLLTSMGFTADRYAEALRKQLATQQLINAVANTDFMLKDETAKLVDLVSQKREIRQATLDVNTMAVKQTTTDDETSQYYQQHKNDFMAPEQFRVSYVKMDAASLQETVSNAEIQSWYEQHKADYTQPERNRYSIIQTKTEADASAVLAQLKGGADFAALAKSKSIDPISVRKGGDMGWLEPATTPDELKNAGLTQKGQLSEVIKSSVGFLVVRLDDIQPKQIKPLAEVRDAVAEKAKQEKAVDAFYQQQQKVSEAASNDNELLAGAAQVSGLNIVETGWFSRDRVPQELNFDAVKNAVFNGGLIGQNGAPGNNSDIITVDGDRAFVLRISEHKPEAVKPLYEVKAQIADTLKHDKATQQAKAQADKLLADLKAGKHDALSAAGLTLSTSKTVDRNSQDPVAQTAFNLPQPVNSKPSWGVSEDMQGNVVLVALDKVSSGSLPPEQVEQMVKGVTQNNGQLAFEALLENLRKAAKIKYGAAAQMQ
ncbi:peptidylprolyl isomerase [Candidatus Pantoea persica]|uniref:peptidylprolyl isomerase n=1 Tax=Candidatus Pantoea persica TaxID=2518128 RepID=UPI00215DBDE5|nr:peptidylprolyl isomerase [Candidatus Pantoea persica]MBA2815380.1 Peptidyl-prolyl cis-trans isomerase D [Candidatus Pantoea persica]